MDPIQKISSSSTNEKLIQISKSGLRTFFKVTQPAANPDPDRELITQNVIQIKEQGLSPYGGAMIKPGRFNVGPESSTASPAAPGPMDSPSSSSESEHFEDSDPESSEDEDEGHEDNENASVQAEDLSNDNNCKNLNGKRQFQSKSDLEKLENGPDEEEEPLEKKQCVSGQEDEDESLKSSLPLRLMKSLLKF